MQFELLANELLLELFEYFDGVHLFRAFYGLNTRFNHLLLLHHQSFHFNFAQIPKEDFDIICKEYLSLIINRVISIEISDDIETPKLPELFLDYSFSLNQFISLKRLTLHSIHTISTLINITCLCQSMPNLEHFNIIDCCFNDFLIDDTDLFDNIWKLPRLTHFNFNGSPAFGKCLLKISQISSTIKNLTIGNCELLSLRHLLEYTPNLQRLDTKTDCSSKYLLLNHIDSLLTHLKIFFTDTATRLIYIFQCLPNLYHLTLKTSSVHWNGCEWKEIIEKYFPKLQVFQFKIEDYRLTSDTNVDNLLDTFRTTFWIDEHQWFVGCQWNPDLTLPQVTLYTLPYIFDSIDYQNDWCFKSTCPDAKTYYSFDHVHKVIYSSDNRSFPDTFPLRFPNIQHLSFRYSFSYELCSWFGSLNQLKSIILPLGEDDDDYVHLQVLLDQAPCLYSIIFNVTSRLSTKFFELTSSSVHKLHLFSSSSDFYLTTYDCTRLISSPLGRQCEILSVHIDNRINILNLIQQMSNLRSLSVYCVDVQSCSENKKHDLFRWLESHLPSTYAFRAISGYLYRIEIWINRSTKHTVPSSEVQNKILSCPRRLKGFFKRFCRAN